MNASPIGQAQRKDRREIARLLANWRAFKRRFWFIGPLACWAFILGGLYAASQNMARDAAYHHRCDALAPSMTPDPMVERVARALAIADGTDPDARNEPFGVCWRDQYADKAAAAISALRARSTMTGEGG